MVNRIEIDGGVLTKKEVRKWVAIELADAKFCKVRITKRKLLNNLYQRLVRGLYSEETFLSHEPNKDFGVNCFIKGYVRDVWKYLFVNYDILEVYVYTGKYVVPEYR